MTDNPIRDADNSERVSRLSSLEAGESDPVVREYEERYGEPRKRREMPRSYSTLHVSEDEKLWAAVAHGCVWLTLVTSVLSFGLLVPISIFIPLVIYFLFRKRSDFVAFHALQAFVLQLIGTVGALLLLIVGGMVWLVGMAVALAAIAILVGFILVPLWGLVGVLLVLASLGLPLAMLFYGTMAAIETYHGRDYRYPFVARWVDRQLAGGLLNVV